MSHATDNVAHSSTETQHKAEHTQPLPESIQIGTEMDEATPYTLSVSEYTKNTYIHGKTGAGKTTIIKRIFNATQNTPATTLFYNDYHVQDLECEKEITPEKISQWNLVGFRNGTEHIWTDIISTIFNITDDQIQDTIRSVASEFCDQDGVYTIGGLVETVESLVTDKDSACLHGFRMEKLNERLEQNELHTLHDKFEEHSLAPAIKSYIYFTDEAVAQTLSDYHDYIDSDNVSMVPPQISDEMGDFTRTFTILTKYAQQTTEPSSHVISLHESIFAWRENPQKLTSLHAHAGADNMNYITTNITTTRDIDLIKQIVPYMDNIISFSEPMPYNGVCANHIGIERKEIASLPVFNFIHTKLSNGHKIETTRGKTVETQTH